MPSTSRGSGTSFLVQSNMEAWVGHPLDPISILFDTLLEASKEEESPHNLGKFIFNSGQFLFVNWEIFVSKISYNQQ